MLIHSLADLKKYKIAKSNGVNGIYLWGVFHNNRYIPLYVGKGRNVHERIFQQISRWRGGEYRVPKGEHILDETKRVKPFTADDNLLYIPHGAYQYSDFLKSSEIQDTINNVIKDFFCVWLSINNSKLLDEEDELATLVGKDRLISSHRKRQTPATKTVSDFYCELIAYEQKTSP
ncbi:MAG: hypothetical protein LWX70_13120 [Sphingobacteriia bacterium]|nr:hypothetical protein [Sphingobacteriia bacterium]